MLDPSPPLTPSSPIGRSALVGALGATRSSLDRALDKGTVAAPDLKTLGGQRRWSLALAARIVSDHGGKVPDAWAKALGKVEEKEAGALK